MAHLQVRMEPVCLTTVIKGVDLAHSGETAVWLKKALEKMAVKPSVIRRAAVTAYEAEMNIAIHAREGIMTAIINPGFVEIRAEDKGPGIPDVDLALQEGYSTAPANAQKLGFGAGMGLPNIRRNADVLEIDSVSNKGTKLRAQVFLGRVSDS